MPSPRPPTRNGGAERPTRPSSIPHLRPNHPVAQHSPCTLCGAGGADPARQCTPMRAHCPGTQREAEHATCVNLNAWRARRGGAARTPPRVAASWRWRQTGPQVTAIERRASARAHTSAALARRPQARRHVSAANGEAPAAAAAAHHEAPACQRRHPSILGWNATPGAQPSAQQEVGIASRAPPGRAPPASPSLPHHARQAATSRQAAEPGRIQEGATGAPPPLPKGRQKYSQPV